MVVRGGQMVAAEELNCLPDELWVGPEWPETQPAESSDLCDNGPLRPGPEVVDEILQRHGAGSQDDKRAHARHAYRVPFQIVLQEHPGGALSERVIQVETNDISRAGFSFLYLQYVAVGTTIRACFDDLPSRPSVLGIVRNCCLVKGRTHRVGVQFLERT